MKLRRCVALLAGILFALQPGLSPGKERRLGAVVAPVRLVPKGSAPIGVSGLQPYFGTVELGVASNGIVVSNRLSLERYLLGLNEVPTDWPAEALKAQVIAARTYALYTLQQPPGGDAAVYGFDICATVQCQVFSGASVVTQDGGARWVEAVDSIRGLAILYRGTPILARYHSTSGGTTFSNSDAFPGEPDYPYLRAVRSTTETASPLYRWRVEFPLDHLTQMMAQSAAWSGSRVRAVHTVADDDGGPYPDVILRGTTAGLRLGADDFRSIVRDAGPALYPGHYPSAGRTSSGRLPETLPSERFDIAIRRRKVIVLGRGWGHGTGMSQWGAHGLAQQGASFEDILHHYYTGVSIEPVAIGSTIEVGVAYGRQEILTSGTFSIVDGNGRTIVKNAVGPWRFANSGNGVIAVDPPEGFGLPLEVGIVKAPSTVDPGEPAYLTIALSRPAEVRAETVGSPERFPKTRIKEAGKRRVTWLAPVDPGRYKVRVRVAIGQTTRFSKPVAIKVKELPRLPRTEEEDPPEPGGSFPAWLTAVLIVVGVLVVGAIASMTGRNTPVPGPPDR